MGEESGSNDGKLAKQPVKIEYTSVTPGAKSLDENPIQYATHEKGILTTNPHDKDYMELVLRSGQHSELVQKILRQRIESRAKDFPRWPAAPGAGVRVMWIESRFWYDRERLLPDFDDDWRRYRAKYLHSLELDPREPVHVPEYEKSLINPIRRFYMKGGDWIEDKILSKIARDKHFSSVYRTWVTRSFISYCVVVGLCFWARYNNRDWELDSGPMLFTSRPVVYPDHPNYPFKEYKKEPAHHYDMGFSSRTIFKDLRDYEDRTAVK